MAISVRFSGRNFIRIVIFLSFVLRRLAIHSLSSHLWNVCYECEIYRPCSSVACLPLSEAHIFSSVASSRTPQLRVLSLPLTINMKMEGQSETVCSAIGTGCCFNSVITMVTSVAVIKVWKLTQ